MLSGELNTPGQLCPDEPSMGVMSIGIDGKTFCGGTGAFCSGKGVQKEPDVAFMSMDAPPSL